MRHFHVRRRSGGPLAPPLAWAGLQHFRPAQRTWGGSLVEDTSMLVDDSKCRCPSRTLRLAASSNLVQVRTASACGSANTLMTQANEQFYCGLPLAESEVRFRRGFVIGADRFLTPTYTISPFSSQHMCDETPTCSASGGVREWFEQRFPGRQAVPTTSGRAAIRLALLHLGVGQADVVTILTTTGNHYISGCVTSEIEKLCKWSRELSPASRVILVNHEFGHPYEAIERLRSHGLPIIEDCAHAFACELLPRLPAGGAGDYAVFSFPKFFPVQCGGMLVLPQRAHVGDVGEPPALIDHVASVVSGHLSHIADWVESRKRNAAVLAQLLAPLDCTQLLPINAGTVPGAFLFRLPPDVDSEALKTHFQGNGVEASVFYGQHAFFVPVHQYLREVDLRYFVALLEDFLATRSKAAAHESGGGVCSSSQSRPGAVGGATIQGKQDRGTQ